MRTLKEQLDQITKRVSLRAAYSAAIYWLPPSNYYLSWSEDLKALVTRLRHHVGAHYLVVWSADPAMLGEVVEVTDVAGMGEISKAMLRKTVDYPCNFNKFVRELDFSKIPGAPTKKQKPGYSAPIEWQRAVITPDGRVELDPALNPSPEPPPDVTEALNRYFERYEEDVDR